MDNMEVFFFIRLFILIITILCGYKYSKCPSNKIFLLIPIILLSINEGLRFGRGTDYNIYYFNYIEIIKGYEVRSNEILFNLLCKLNNIIGFQYQGVIFIMSLILYVSAAFFLRRHISVIYLALPLFFLFTLEAENLMRWFTAFSFLLIGISYLEQKKLKLYLFYSFLSCLFHSGIIVVIPFFLLISFINKPIIKPLPACIIYLLIYFFFKTRFMLNFVSYMNIFSGMEQFSGYVNNADEWLTGTANYISQKPNIGTIIIDLIIMKLGYELLRLRKHLIYYYNLCIIGTILSPALYQIEILYRINLLFKLFQFIIVAYSISSFVLKKENFQINSILTLILVFNLIRIHIINILIKPYTPNSYLYIWDKMGREYLFI